MSQMKKNENQNLQLLGKEICVQKLILFFAARYYL